MCIFFYKKEEEEGLTSFRLKIKTETDFLYNQTEEVKNHTSWVLVRATILMERINYHSECFYSELMDRPIN